MLGHGAPFVLYLIPYLLCFLCGQPNGRSIKTFVQFWAKQLRVSSVYISVECVAYTNSKWSDGGKKKQIKIRGNSNNFLEHLLNKC